MGAPVGNTNAVKDKNRTKFIKTNDGFIITRDPIIKKKVSDPVKK
ncbi:MAG TPA: hypothetical protein PL092_01970 [Candidatus Pacearchaeota archaeon]|nr:hypothetical protein [Candidatus Pacearchaeota archaeon]